MNLKIKLKILKFALKKLFKYLDADPQADNY